MDIQQPEEQAEEAKNAYQDGDYQAAAQGFEAAAAAYQAQEKHPLAAEMTNNQSVALLQAGQPQAALDVLNGTEEIFEQAGDKLKLALAKGNRAAALEALKAYQDAEQAYTESAEILAAIGESEYRAVVMQALSGLQLRSGRQLEALASMQAGVTHIEKPSFKQRLIKKLLDISFKLFNR